MNRPHNLDLQELANIELHDGQTVPQLWEKQIKRIGELILQLQRIGGEGSVDLSKMNADCDIIADKCDKHTYARTTVRIVVDLDKITVAGVNDGTEQA